MSRQDAGLGPPAVKPQPRWQRWVIGLCGLVALAGGISQIVGAFSGRSTLPACDSRGAKDALSDAFKKNNLSPTGYKDVTTLSSSADMVDCHATLSTNGATTLDVKYTFFWSGSDPQIRYTIRQQ